MVPEGVITPTYPDSDHRGADGATRETPAQQPEMIRRRWASRSSSQPLIVS